MATQTINFNDVQSVKFNGNDVESIKFNGTQIWEKQTTPVVDSTFGNNSWATISAISQIIASQGMTSSQVYSNYGWQLGDTKSITLSNNETIQVRIIGFNHDTLSSDHSSKAGITLQMVNCLATRYSMNASSNAGGWNGSVMRTSTLPTIKALLPSDLQSVIKLVDKKAANGGSSNYSAMTTSSDDLFFLAEIEIFGTITYAQNGSNEGTQYAYWASHNQANDRIKYYDNAGTPTATYWWERSSYSNSLSNFCCVRSNGNASYSGPGYSRGVAFGFCV